MRIYLDNCCYNRPFDNQEQPIVRQETDAKLRIQGLVRAGTLELVWSFVLDYENAANPASEARERIAEWVHLSVVDIDFTPEVEQLAEKYVNMGLRQKDASHLACAIIGKAEFFLTTDKKILNKPIHDIIVMNPIKFWRRYFENE